MPIEQLFPIIVCAFILAGGLGTAIYMLCTGKTKIQEFLLGVLSEMRRATGEPLIISELQIAEVYNIFITQFPGFAKFVSLAVFRGLLAKSLELMEELISSDALCAAYIASGKNEKK